MAPTLYDLEPVHTGDFGWCLYEDANRRVHLVDYDDDEYFCSIGRASFAEHQCGRRCLDSSAIVVGLDGRSSFAPHGSLFHLPYVAISSTCKDATREGWIYVVALIPDLDIRRLKIGFSATSAITRISDFKTTNPTKVLVGLWKADSKDERRAHAITEGRIGLSEVFDVRDLGATLATLDKELGKR